MPRAKLNPIGMEAPDGVVIVRAGKEGEFTHILNPNDPKYGRVHMCRSGIKHGNVPKLYRSTGRFVTCYRCAKLAQINLRKYGRVLP